MAKKINCTKINLKTIKMIDKMVDTTNKLQNNSRIPIEAMVRERLY